MENNLKKIREEAGLNVYQLEDRSGVFRGTINRLERLNTAGVTLATAYRLASALDKDVTEIWPNTNEIITEEITVRRVKMPAKKDKK